MAKKKGAAKKSSATSTPTAPPTQLPTSPQVDVEQQERKMSIDEPVASPDVEMKDDDTVEEILIDPVVRAEQLKEEGNAKFKMRKYDDAIRLYTEAITLNPAEPNYLTNRAASYMAIKRFTSACDDCQRAAKLQPTPTAKTLVRLAKCQLALGGYTATLSTVERVFAIDPNDQAARKLEAGAKVMRDHVARYHDAMEGKDYSMARLALEAAGKECEGDIPIDWRCWRVRLDLARGQLNAASQAASDAHRLAPHSPDVMALRGLLLYLNNQFAQCISHLQAALRLDPEHSGARILLRKARDIERIKDEGNKAFKLGQLTGSVGKYTEALDLVGEREDEAKGGLIRAVLLSNRSTALLKLERYQEALDDIKISITLHPASYKALRTRARIQQALEDYEAAVQDFKDAIETCGIDGNVSEERSLAQELKKAEILLKRSKTKDYYKILNLPKTCADSDIKKAYRRESLIHHPDKGGDEEKFKLVVEAHAVLSDPQRRHRYDNGHDEDGQTDSSGMGGMHGGMGGMDLSELFAQMGGGGGFRPGFGGGGGGGGGHFHGF